METASPEVAKLEQEVKTLRVQRWVLIIGAGITVLGFLITNLGAIKHLFVSDPEPAIAFRAQDPFVASEGVVTITKASAVTATFSLAKTQRAVVTPGQYHWEVTAGDEVVDYGDVLVNPRTRMTVDVKAAAKIRVSVQGVPPRVHANELLQFTVAASGRGFLWVARSTAPKKCVLAFPYHPDGTSIAPDENTIAPDSSRPFSLAAPDERGNGTLWVLVTSTQDPALARSIFEHYCELEVAKAAGADVKENWGLQIVPLVVD